MAVLWFVHAVEMYGYPAYRFDASELVRKFGGGASFRFLGRLDQKPSAPDRITVITWRIMIECYSNWLMLKRARCAGDLDSMKLNIAAKMSLTSWASQTFPQRMP
jgi:hypothetical protein